MKTLCGLVALATVGCAESPSDTGTAETAVTEDWIRFHQSSGYDYGEEGDVDGHFDSSDGADDTGDTSDPFEPLPDLLPVELCTNLRIEQGSIAFLVDADPSPDVSRYEVRAVYLEITMESCVFNQGDAVAQGDFHAKTYFLTNEQDLAQLRTGGFLDGSSFAVDRYGTTFTAGLYPDKTHQWEDTFYYLPDRSWAPSGAYNTGTLSGEDGERIFSFVDDILDGKYAPLYAVAFVDSASREEGYGDHREHDEQNNWGQFVIDMEHGHNAVIETQYVVCVEDADCVNAGLGDSCSIDTPGTLNNFTCQ
jgi:hypothetical protein